MPNMTNLLKLFMYDPDTDHDLYFNIEDALNDNWRKLDKLVPYVAENNAITDVSNVNDWPKAVLSIMRLNDATGWPASAGVVLTLRYDVEDNNSYMQQLFFATPANDKEIYRRSLIPGDPPVWTNFTKVSSAQAGDVSFSAPGFTATNVSAALVELLSLLTDHANATTGVHGATSEATPNTIVQRDGSGQFEVGAPTADNHVARKVDLDEVKQSVSDGKNQIASAITDMGQSASGSDTFAQLSSKIRDISKDANAAVGDVLTGKTFYQGGVKRTGTMPNNGSVSQTLTSQGEEYTIPEGYHDGTGTVTTDIVNLSAGNIRAGATVGGVDGTFTSDATATAGQILSGQTAYVNGSKVTGSMINNGAVSQTLTTQGASYTIPAGYHNGSGTVTANITNLTAANIKAGTTVGGVSGTFTSDATATAAQIMSGRTAYVNGSKVTGTMPVKTNDYGAPRTGQPGRLYVTPEAGYHDGTVRVYTDDGNFTPANIKSGVTMFGITGTYAPISTGSTTLTFNRSGSGNNVSSIIYRANYTPPKTNFLGSFQIPVTFTIGNIEYKGDPFNSITVGYPTNLTYGYGLYIGDPTVNAEIQISAIYTSSTGIIQLQIGNPSSASPKALFTNISTDSFTTGLRYVSWE